MRWGLVACALAGCSFEHGRYLADAGGAAVIDAPPSDAEIDAVPETVCRVGVTSATGTARGRVGGSGGGANFPPLACANATDRIVGVALRMSDQDTLYGGRSAYGIQIACAPVTVGSAGTAVTGTVTTYEVSGSGTMGWSPSTWTPVTQCKPGWIVSGLGAHTSEDGDLFVDATITCSQVSATGTLVASEMIYVAGSLEESEGADTVACDPGEILVRFTERTGSGLDSVDLYCTTPTCS